MQLRRPVAGAMGKDFKVLYDRLTRFPHGTPVSVATMNLWTIKQNGQGKWYGNQRDPPLGSD